MNETGVTGRLSVLWKESDIGIQTALCPCGNVSELLNLTITRMCRGDIIAEWEPPNNTACNGLSFAICELSEVRMSDSNIPVRKNGLNASVYLIIF